MIAMIGVVGLVITGCVDTEPNNGYCATVNGDAFCGQRHGAEDDPRRYCVLGTPACLAEHEIHEPSEDFDGCIDREPTAHCYSECGGGIAQSEGSCPAGGSGATAGAGSGGGTMGADGIGTSEGMASTTAMMGAGSSEGGGMECVAAGVNSNHWCSCSGEAECAEDEVCLMASGGDANWSICVRSCNEDRDCSKLWPEGLDVNCRERWPGGDKRCYLECSGGGDCPEGMLCVGESFCAVME